VADEQRSWWRGRPALAIAGAVLLAGLAWLWWKGAEWLYQNNTMNADRLKATTDTRTALLAGCNHSFLKERGRSTLIPEGAGPVNPLFLVVIFLLAVLRLLVGAPE